MSLSFELSLPDEQASARLARHLAAALASLDGAVIYLRGPLGAGKTTIARELLRKLGVTGTIRSPTYTLMELYELADRRVLHMDLYRIDASELDQLGLDDYPPTETLWLIEWPENGQGRLPPADLDLYLRPENGGRHARLTAESRSLPLFETMRRRLLPDST